MTAPTKPQLLAVIGALLLFVLLLLSRKTENAVTEKVQTRSALQTFSIDKLIDSVKAGLDNKLLTLMAEQEKQENRIAAQDSLAKIWRFLKQPGIQAACLEKIALMSNTCPTWNAAGEAFYKASHFSEENWRHFYMDKAVSAYQKASQIDSSNTDAKLNLAICYVEGTSEPMKGILLLREIVAQDSTNIKAQLSLGMFAVQSGQLEKALERFKRIVKIDPNFAEAYLYMGETLVKLGRKSEAIEALEQFKNKSKDETVVSEVANYIDQLKNS